MCSGLAALRGGGFQLWHRQVFLFLSQMRKTLQPVPLLRKTCLLVTVAMGTTNSHVIYSYHLSHCVALLPVLPPRAPPTPFSSPPYVHLLPTSCTHTLHLLQQFSGQCDLVFRHLVYKDNEC